MPGRHALYRTSSLLIPMKDSDPFTQDLNQRAMNSQQPAGRICPFLSLHGPQCLRTAENHREYIVTHEHNTQLEFWRPLLLLHPRRQVEHPWPHGHEPTAPLTGPPGGRPSACLLWGRQCLPDGPRKAELGKGENMFRVYQPRGETKR